jgi:protein-S-isoprenylcysteine O-methyltransferase Ste14
MKRTLILVYGVASYFVFFATFLYAFGFIGNILVPKSIDSGRTVPFFQAVVIDAALLAIFALQHSIMARRGFKRMWTKIVPEPAERSTYTLFSSLALILLFAFWQPVGGVVWDIETPALRGVMYGLCVFGWLLVLVSTFRINHFDLFGLRQVYLYFRGIPYTPLRFRTPIFYGYVRHPLYLGWLFAFWATPTMTAAHLLFAMLATAYILVAIQLEERDLVAAHGHSYREYRKRVPMILPVRFGKGAMAAPEASPADTSRPAGSLQSPASLSRRVSVNQ